MAPSMFARRSEAATRSGAPRLSRLLPHAVTVLLAGSLASCGSGDGDPVLPDPPPPTFDEEGTWERRGLLPVGIRAGGAAVHGDFLYAAGGFAGEEPSPAVQRYDPDADRWERLGDLPEPLGFPALVVHRDTLLLIGGNGGTDSEFRPRGAVLRYDPDGDEWLEHSVMQDRRYKHGAASFGDLVVVVGGMTPGDSSSIYRDGAWRRGPPPPRSHDLNLSVFGAAGKRFFALKSPNAGFDAFDAEAESWEVVSTTHPVDEFVDGAGGWKGRFHVFSSRGPTPFHRAWDPEREEWLRLPPPPEVIRELTVAALGDRLYLIGGLLRSGETTRAVWSFEQP